MTVVAAPGEFTLRRPTFSGHTGFHQFLAQDPVRDSRAFCGVSFFWVLIALAGFLSLGSFVKSRRHLRHRDLPGIADHDEHHERHRHPVPHDHARVLWRRARLAGPRSALPGDPRQLSCAELDVRALEDGRCRHRHVFIFLVVTAVLLDPVPGTERLHDESSQASTSSTTSTTTASCSTWPSSSPIALQILAPNKYFGMLFMVLYIVALITLPGAGFEDPLYLYGRVQQHPLLGHERL